VEVGLEGICWVFSRFGWLETWFGRHGGGFGTVRTMSTGRLINLKRGEAIESDVGTRVGNLSSFSRGDHEIWYFFFHLAQSGNGCRRSAPLSLAISSLVDLIHQHLIRLPGYVYLLDSTCYRLMLYRCLLNVTVRNNAPGVRLPLSFASSAI
jgi:hypothetical protein